MLQENITMSKRKLDEAAIQAKEERRKRKKDRKEALKYEDITPSSTDVTGPSTPVAEAVDNEEGYKQNAELDAVPQSDVDAFHTSEHVQTDDPQSSTLRPMLKFSHLPIELYTQYYSIFKSFDKPSSIQSSAWPHLLSGRDLVGVAETGSGKTLAFGLPLVARLSTLEKKKGVRAVVIAPTRELAIQVFDQIDTLCKLTSSLRAVCIYGGTNKDDQRRNLKKANIVVATPGRMKDFMSDYTLSVSKTRYLVLDEADRMLDKGFEDDIKHIVSQMPSSSKRQTAMFTATWPTSIRNLASTFMEVTCKSLHWPKRHGRLARYTIC